MLIPFHVIDDLDGVWCLRKIEYVKENVSLTKENMFTSDNCPLYRLVADKARGTLKVNFLFRFGGRMYSVQPG